MLTCKAILSAFDFSLVLRRYAEVGLCRAPLEAACPMAKTHTKADLREGLISADSSPITAGNHRPKAAMFRSLTAHQALMMDRAGQIAAQFLSTFFLLRILLLI